MINTCNHSLLIEGGLGVNVIICEDEAYYREAISRVVDEWKQVTQHPDVTYMTFSSSEDFLERWENSLISDLLFLDIEIPNRK